MGQWRYGSTHSQPRHYIEMVTFRTQPLRSPVTQWTSDWTDWRPQIRREREEDKKKSLGRLWNRTPSPQQLISSTDVIHDNAITKII